MIFGKTFTEKGYAKINLYLDVVSKNEDGYHGIESVMQSLNLCDEISLSIDREKTDVLTSSSVDVPTDEKNIAVKMLNAFRTFTGLDFTAKIHIEKRIPMAAGLAGGSADAAAVLKLLLKATETDLSEKDIIGIASSIGADVPFCYFGGTYLAEGKGEMLKKLPSCPEIPCVVAIKGERVSTPWAYAKLDEKYDNFAKSRAHSKERLDSIFSALDKADKKAICDGVYNIFESEIEPLRPEITNIKRVMLENGAVSALMSGSGPSVFGFFKSHDEAKKAEIALKKIGAEAFACTTM